MSGDKMQYREIAKESILLYGRYVVKNGYDSWSISEYREQFYKILEYILGMRKEITESEKKIANGYKKILSSNNLLRPIKRNKEIVYNVIKAMFDIVMRDLKERGV